MNDLTKFLKTTGIYLIGNILTKLMSFLLIPLYTNYILPDVFGKYDLDIAYNTFISAVLFFDIWDVMMRYVFEYKEEKEKPLTVAMGIYIVSLILYGLALFTLIKPLNIDFGIYLFFIGFFTSLQNVIGFFTRTVGKNKEFVFSGFLSAIINFSLSIILIIYFKMSIEALYISSISGMLVNIIYLSKQTKFFLFINFKKIDKSLFKEMLLYALPLSLNSASYWFLTGFNRVIISNVLSASENGIYAIATKFSGLVVLITTGFQMAWQELAYSKANMDRENMGIFYTKAFKAYVIFIHLGVILLLPCIKLIFPYAVGTRYLGVLNLIPLIMYATLLSSISSFLASIIGVLKKSTLIFKTTLLAAIINIVVVMLGINVIGIQITNISLCVAYGANVISKVILIKKYIKLEIDIFSFIPHLIMFIFIAIIFIYGNVWLNLISLLGTFIFIILSYKDTFISIKKERNR